MAHRFRLLAFLAVVSAIALQLPVNRARSAEPFSQEATGSGTSHEIPSTLDAVTIQARRDSEIRREITKFVSGVVVSYFNESLKRWNQPICPLVAGLPSEPAEFIRTRVSQVARDSHAPLGSEHCKPNLIVVISNDPDRLLENWYKRSPGWFNACNGLGPIKNFLHSREAVRVYYNTNFASAEAEARPPMPWMGYPHPPDCQSMTSSADSVLLHHGSVQELTSVIIVVDGRQTTKINMGQLSDYIAMIGLAQIHMRADPGTAPSILHLFQGSDPQPQGLSPWDEAFLHTLYTTDQWSAHEVSMMEDRMFEQIAGR